jgi:quercetin dioxygenase-like cupin family protein
VLIAVVCLLAAGSAPTSGKKPAAPAKIDAKALTTMLQHFDKVEQVKYPWGWIRWLMSSQLDPQSQMTLGIVYINAGQANPLHVHPNCEELIYVLSGSCEHRIGEQTVVLKAGDVLRIPMGVPHAARTSQQGPVRAVVVYSSGERQMVAIEQ